MDSWQWRARIDTDDAAERTLGAGFLVDQQRLLTCAHLVRGLATVRVTFPGALSGLRATVIPLTGWTKPGDPGDMSLLRLDAPVPAAPCRIAEPAGTYWAGELRAGGFRTGFEKTGSYVTLSTAPDMELAAEWWQVDIDPNRPERLAEGFSGSAVYLVATGEVVGMITDADLRRGGLMGAMMPLSALRGHWEELDDLLWLPWAAQAHARELRKIVANAAAPLAQIYLEAFPGMTPGRELRSVWDAIRYVAEEGFEEDRIPRFLALLVPHLPVATAAQLVSWARQVLRVELSSVRKRATHGPASIIVRLDRQTHGNIYELSFTSLVDGIPRQAVPAVEVTAAQVRGQVEKTLPELIRDVLGQDWMIEFAVPESWLNRAVEEWKAGATLMLAYPVVVRDVERLKPTFRQDCAIRRWVLLRDRATALGESVACANTRTRNEHFYWLTSREDICVLVHAEQPRPLHLTAALEAGIPVMLWQRSKCSDEEHSECAGALFAGELMHRVAGAHPDDLPRLVRKLRAEARSQPGGHLHSGRRLVLFWDDPARLPDPPLGAAK